MEDPAFLLFYKKVLPAADGAGRLFRWLPAEIRDSAKL